MKVYKPRKGIAIYELLFLFIIINVLAMYVLRLLNSYLALTLVRVCMVAFSIYSIYYILVALTLTYNITDNYIEINSLYGLKRIKLNLSNVDGYHIQKNSIKGIQLSGVGKFKYSFGRSVIEGAGITYMFVTSSKESLYLHTDDMAYGISPEEIKDFKDMLEQNGIKEKVFETKKSKETHLFKQKTFFVPFIIVTIVIIFMTLNPFILYLAQKLPDKMPIMFNASFMPVVWGSGKQFAFKQMMYGAMNMVILFCMHYAAYFCAKYDKKSAYKYIYVALICALTFLVMQIKILSIYM